MLESERSLVEETDRQQLVMINTCLNVNKIAPTAETKTMRYAKMEAGEEPSSEESVSERHDVTLDVQPPPAPKIHDEELQEYEQDHQS